MKPSKIQKEEKTNDFENRTSKLSKKHQTIIKDLGYQLISNFGRDLIRSGTINATGKNDEELRQEIWNYIHTNVVDSEAPIYVTIDHTSNLLKKARGHHRQKEYDDAFLFYAFWFEHWLNRIVVFGGERRKLSAKKTELIIRETDLGRGKTTWLLSLLELPPLNEAHRKKMLKIAELRNSYVHYKWKAVDIDKNKEVEYEICLADIEKTIRYFQSYERKNFFGNNKNKIKSIMRPI